MISDEIGLTITNECDFDDYTFGSPHNVSAKCNSALSEANRIVGNYINSYDVILDVCYPSVVEQELRLKKMVHKFFQKTKTGFFDQSISATISVKQQQYNTNNISSFLTGNED